MAVDASSFVRPPDPQIAMVLVEPMQQVVPSRFARWILQEVKPAVEWVWNVTVETVKTEGLAITLLVLSILGIFPVWLNLLSAALAITRLGWANLQLRLSNQHYRDRNRDLIQQVGVLHLSSRELTFQKEQAVGQQQALIQERNQLRFSLQEQEQQRRSLQEQAQLADQEKNQVQEQLQQLKARQELWERGEGLGKKREDASQKERDLLRTSLRCLQKEKQEQNRLLEQTLVEKRELETAFAHANKQRDDLLREKESWGQRADLAPLQQKCIELEASKQTLLQRIADHPHAGSSQHVDGEIEMLCRSQREQKGVQEALEGALLTLPAGHPSRHHIEKLRLLLLVERQSLDAVAHSFRLHSALQEWEKQCALGIGEDDESH